jgi:hypothetical protein
MTAPGPKHLGRSVLRQTGRDPALVGYWLARHRRAERLSPARQARALGMTLEGLMVLSLCRTPREDRFREDLEVICRRSGADPARLASLVRQQQALARWAEQAPSGRGWLMAAADAPPAAQDDQPPPSPDGSPDEA